MESFMKEFEHLVIKLEDIKSATANFDENNIIGSGGFGKVYKGEVSHSKGRSVVAFKRLDRRFGQGDPEFWKEIMMLSRYTHKNLVSLLGFCNEGGEKVLVYEYASNGSLDRHLSSNTLTWTHRIKICLDAAKALSYLHEDRGNHQRVIHRDIKSSNILLDENWNSLVSDMGLAKIGPANQQYTALITNIVGTLGYLDPVYLHMGILTKESDVYSFGVVLFEVLCGRVCFEKSNVGLLNLVPTWKKSCKLNKIDELIFKDSTVKNMDPTSLVTFTYIALRCLNKSREARPTMSAIVEKLEIALRSQEPVDGLIRNVYQVIAEAVVPPLIYGSIEELKVLLSKEVLLNRSKKLFCLNEKGQHIERIFIEACLNPDTALHSKDDDEDWVNSRWELQVFEEYQHIIEVASQSLFYTSLDELKQILRIGIHLNDYKTWFSLNEKGEQCHMISMEDCLILDEDFTPRYESNPWSRFPAGVYDTKQKGFRTHVKTQLLSPLIPYTVNIVFHLAIHGNQSYVDLKYKITGETRTSSVYLADSRSDCLYMAELYQVTCNGGLVDLEIEFDDHGTNISGVEGILFQPLEKVEEQVLEDDKVEDIQPILDSDSDSDTYWGQKLPSDSEEILKLSNHSIEGKTKKELYSLLCQGFVIDNGQQWFSV